MLDHRENLHDISLGAIIVGDQLCEAYEFAAEVGTEKYGAIQECSVLPAHSIEGFPIVPEPLSLTDGTFIIDPVDTADICIVELYFSNYHTTLLSLADLVPHSEIDLLFP